MTRAPSLSSGGVKCWGNNNVGQLGDGTTAGRYTPVSVVGLLDGVDVERGVGHTCAGCALTSSRAVKCWGANGYGQLGDGTTTERLTPVTVVGLSNATALAAGSEHTCALLLNGTVQCWGYNSNGQLGDGTTIERHTPVGVPGLATGTIKANWATAQSYRATCQSL
jgi:alpha-tubulin suppressor-like RCC1 family protein